MSNMLSWQARSGNWVAAHLCMIEPLGSCINVQLDGSVLKRQYTTLSWPLLLPYKSPAQTGCENQSCKSLLHSSFPCLNSQGTKMIHLLFIHFASSQYPMQQQCSLGMTSPISITIRPKQFRLGILVWRSFIIVNSLHMLSHHHEPFQIYQ